MTRCPNCGHINDKDASFCEKCGANLRAPAGMSNLTKVLIVVIIILVGTLGVVAGMMLLGNQKAPANNTTVVINQTTQQVASAEWHQIDTFSGVTNTQRTINIKGNKFKVVMSAMPKYNNATNYMTTDILEANRILNSGTVSWGSTDPLTSKESTIEVTAPPGTYTLKIYTKDLQSWTITLYDYY